MKYTKAIIVTLFCIGLVLGSVSLTFGQGGAPSYAGVNFKKIALLKWYAANQSGASFTAGAQPGGMAFDGANIWVANFKDGTVTKLQSADGANLGTFDAGGSPHSLVFDGAYIWVTNRAQSGAPNGFVSKLWAADPNDPNHQRQTFTAGVHDPFGLAFDGTNIWVANFGDNTVAKLLASSGANLGTFPVGVRPYSVAFDGANIWVTNRTSGTVTKLRASDGANLGTFPVGSNPTGLAFDGASIWVANNQSSTVTKLRASNGAPLGTFNVNLANGVAFDGANIWVTSGGFVVQLRASDGANLGQFLFPNRCINACVDLAFDGANIWVTTDEAVGKL